MAIYITAVERYTYEMKNNISKDSSRKSQHKTF